MNKKILIGSIIAVVILVLVSFTSVVGFQTTKSSTIARASPLFSVRSSRAIDEESKDLTCDYVGKGEGITIPLPMRDIRNKFLQKFIDIISKMDDRTFNKFINSVIERIYQSNKVGKDITLEQLQLLYHLKYTPEVFKINQFNIKRNETNQPTRLTLHDDCCKTWFNDPNCELQWRILIFIFMLIIMPLLLVENFIYGFFAFYCLIAPFNPTFE